MNHSTTNYFAACAALLLAAAGPTGAAVEVVAGDAASLQRAIDANPGQMVFVPAGDYAISTTLKLGSNNSGLWGPGTIIQTNPEADIINIEGCADIQLRDLTLTRPEGRMDTHRPGVRLVRCNNVKIDNLRIFDNRGDLGSIFAAYCQGLQIRNTYIRNYSRIAIDDRTTIPFYGFAFSAINGTGMLIRHSTGTLIQNNRIIETVMIPTPELQKKYGLGKFTKKNPVKGEKVAQAMWDEEYFNGWHQGAAIQITKGETSDYVQLLGNYVENAAQGIDIHGDHVIMAHNIINNAFIGMKAIHGSRNVIIIGNQFSRNDLWSIQLQPGTASHAAFSNEQASAPDPADPEALTWSINRPGANIDGSSIIANNIISDFGYGTAHWMWPSAGTAPIQFNVSPDPVRSPPETNVIISGNILYDTGRDQILVDGKPQVEPPRYKYAVRIGTGEHAPRGLHFSDNLFHPGTDGVANVELPR
jgi:hypothetical protein